MDNEINFNDYRKIQSIRLAGLTLFMGWNPKDSKNTYLLCDIVSCDLGDIFKNAIVSNEYLEIAQGYVERMGKQLAIAKEFRDKRSLPVQMLGTKHCRKRDEKESLAGNLIILKPENLSPEYRTADCQLVIATGGFGCEPNARGRAVYVKELYFEMNRKAPRTCGYLHNDAEKNFKARDPAFQYQSLEDAVRGRLTATYNLPAATPGLSEFIDEGLRMFDEEKLSLARERLDGGKTLAACNSTIPREIRARIIRDVLEVTALYAYFRYDTQRIYAGTDIWNALFARWECFPGSTGDMLRLLLDIPELPQIKMLAGMIGRSEASALEKVRKIAFYCRWWDIPSALLPYLVRKHLDDKVGIRCGVFSFRRAVSLRHDPFACAGDEIDVGTQAIAGRPGNDHRRERVGSHRESGYASDFGAQWNSARSGRLVDRPQ